MKNLFTIFAVVLSVAVTAQSKQERQALANTKLLAQTVFGTKDSLTLEKLFAKDAIYIHSSGKVETREEAIRNIVRNKSVYTKSDTLISYNLENLKDSIAVTHLFIAKEKKPDGSDGMLRLSIRLVWIKEKGELRLLRRVAKKA